MNGKNFVLKFPRSNEFFHKDKKLMNIELDSLYADPNECILIAV